MDESRRRVTVVLFDGFELLDVFGPVGLFSMIPDAIAVEMIGPSAGPVRSSLGAEVVATASYDDAKAPDIVLLPGGRGSRALVNDDRFLTWISQWSSSARLVTSVCTGSAVLAAAGLLDGYRATSNKRAWEWATSHGTSVEWIAKARWVEDRDRWTSSGVAAGMDMATALVTQLFGNEKAQHMIAAAEIEVHTESDWDPFAELNGLA